MFDFDAGKLLIIGIVALVFIPSKDLPRTLRQIGQFVGKMRRMAADFQGQFMDAMRDADMAELRKEAETLKRATDLNLSLAPLRDLHAEVHAVLDAKPGLAAADASVLGAASESADTREQRSTATPELTTHTRVEGDLVQEAGVTQVTAHGEGVERLTSLERAREGDRAEAMDSVSRPA